MRIVDFFDRICHLAAGMRVKNEVMQNFRAYLDELGLECTKELKRCTEVSS